MRHRSLLVLVVLLAGAIAHAAPARYEAMTYEAPKGWKVTSDAKGVQMQSVDVKANTFADRDRAEHPEPGRTRRRLHRGVDREHRADVQGVGCAHDRER